MPAKIDVNKGIEKSMTFRVLFVLVVIGVLVFAGFLVFNGKHNKIPGGFETNIPTQNDTATRISIQVEKNEGTIIGTQNVSKEK